MGLFDSFTSTNTKKKKTSKSTANDKPAPKVYTPSDYTEWEKDLGFLGLIIDRKKNITKNYYINIFASQLQETDYIRDEDLEGIIFKGVTEVIKEISPNYKKHLTTRYFANETQLVKFITEEFYVDLTAAAINQNNTKIRKNVFRKNVESISKITKQQNKEEEAEKEESEE
jgi:hypothetical protein